LHGLRCGTSKLPVTEQRQINRLHAEKMKRWKDAAEAKAERKRKRKAKHDKVCKLARVEGKPRPATPESSEEDVEVASDAEDHSPRGDGEAVGASPPSTYEWDADEGTPAAVEETRVVAESSAGPSLEGAERESSPPKAGEEMPVPRCLFVATSLRRARSHLCWQPRVTRPTRGGRPWGNLRGAARCRGPEEAPRGSGA